MEEMSWTLLCSVDNGRLDSGAGSLDHDEMSAGLVLFVGDLIRSWEEWLWMELDRGCWGCESIWDWSVWDAGALGERNPEEWGDGVRNEVIAI